MLKSTFAVLFIAFTFSCKQSTLKVDKDKDRIDKVCDEFMVKISNSQIAEAMDLLKGNSVFSQSQVDTIQEKTTKDLEIIIPTYGKIIGFEFIEERKIKDFIAKRFYILKFEKYFLKFDFLLYKNESNWNITSFNYNENFVEVLF